MDQTVDPLDDRRQTFCRKTDREGKMLAVQCSAGLAGWVGVMERVPNGRVHRG